MARFGRTACKRESFPIAVIPTYGRYRFIRGRLEFHHTLPHPSNFWRPGDFTHDLWGTSAYLYRCVEDMKGLVEELVLGLILDGD